MIYARTAGGGKSTIILHNGSMIEPKERGTPWGYEAGDRLAVRPGKQVEIPKALEAAARKAAAAGDLTLSTAPDLTV